MNDSPTSLSHSRVAGPLIGRGHQIAEIQALLGNPECRLLTLHGPGGIGKTQLALAAVADLGRAVYFVSLEAIEPAGNDSEVACLAIAQAIARSTGFRSFSGGDMPEQVRNMLVEKDWILVLDNFEHLLAGRSYVTDILNSAPNLKLIVTSRAQLNLADEWIIQVDGLDTAAPAPDPGRNQDHDRSPAASLFISHANEAAAGFDAAEHDEAIDRLCRMLEGSPLSIKLAAGLIAERTPAEIADRLTQNLDLLHDTNDAVVSRHASVRSVIDSSWRLLPERERLAFARLSMLVDSFNDDAAAQVANCDAATLAILVDRNWVRLEQSRTGVRYGLHPLLQTYGQDKLTNSTAAMDPHAEGIQSRHANFFMALLARHSAALQSIDDEAFYQIDLELHNLRLAWTWLQAEREATDVVSFVEAMHFYFIFKGNREEAIDILEGAIAMASVPLAERVRWGRMLTQCYYQKEQFDLSWQAGLRTLEAVGATSEPPGWQLSLALPPLAAGHLKDKLFGVRPLPAEPWASDQAYIMARMGTIGYLSADDPVALLVNALRTGRFARQRLMPAGIMWSQAYLAVLFRAFGMHRLADHYTADAYRHLDDLKGDTFSLLACQSLCVGEIMGGHWEGAQRLLDLKFSKADAIADWRLQQDNVALHGVINLARGDLPGATVCWQTLVDNGRAKNDALVELWGRIGLLESSPEAGAQIDDAQLSEAASLLTTGSRHESARLSAATAAIYWRRGLHQQAIAAATEALQALKTSRVMPFYSVRACRSTAEVLIAALHETPADADLDAQARDAERLMIRVSRAHLFGRAATGLLRGDLAALDGKPKVAGRLWRNAHRLALRFGQDADAQAAVKRLASL